MSSESVQYRCPFCDYVAQESSSVEAHISGSRDPDHQGKVGQDYRDEIVATEVSGIDGSSDESGGILSRAKNLVGAGRNSPSQDDFDEQDVVFYLIDEDQEKTIREFDSYQAPEYVKYNEEIREGRLRLQRVVDGRFGEVEWREDFGSEKTDQREGDLKHQLRDLLREIREEQSSRRSDNLEAELIRAIKEEEGAKAALDEYKETKAIENGNVSESPIERVEDVTSFKEILGATGLAFMEEPDRARQITRSAVAGVKEGMSVDVGPGAGRVGMDRDRQQDEGSNQRRDPDISDPQITRQHARYIARNPDDVDPEQVRAAQREYPEIFSEYGGDQDDLDDDRRDQQREEVEA